MPGRATQSSVFVFAKTIKKLNLNYLDEIIRPFIYFTGIDNGEQNAWLASDHWGKDFSVFITRKDILV